eukprot:8296236-Pyramimonas_sp.AAC.1
MASVANVVANTRSQDNMFVRLCQISPMEELGLCSVAVWPFPGLLAPSENNTAGTSLRLASISLTPGPSVHYSEWSSSMDSDLR